MEKPQKERNPNYLPYPPQSQGDEIELRELFQALWKGKWIIIATTLLFAIGSVVYALSLPNIYKSDALLAPTESSNGGGLSQMAGQLGGLAALAGVNIAGAEASQAELAIQVIKSRKFIEEFIDSHDLLVPLLATKGWDLANNELIIDDDIYSAEKKEWLRKPDGLRGNKPSSQEAYEYFIENILDVKKDKDSGLYIFSIKHYSPYISQQWVSWLIEDINKVMRNRTITETSRNLAYLNMQLKKTAITDMQSTFFKLIEEQTKTLMLAEVQEEFVFKVIDPAVIPEVKSEPKRALICVIGTAIGGLLGIIFVLFFLISQQKKYVTSS